MTVFWKIISNMSQVQLVSELDKGVSQDLIDWLHDRKFFDVQVEHILCRCRQKHKFSIFLRLALSGNLSTKLLVEDFGHFSIHGKVCSNIMGKLIVSIDAEQIPIFLSRDSITALLRAGITDLEVIERRQGLPLSNASLQCALPHTELIE